MTHTCYECEREFGSFQAVQNHCEALGHNRASHCRPCGRLFISARALEQHDEARHGTRCGTCNISLSYGDTMDQHDRLFHTFRCNFCTEICRTQQRFSDHYNDEHEYCQECSEWFADENSLEAHDAVTHSFTCPECPDRSFKTTVALQAHQESPAHPLKCWKCAQSFKYDENRIMHLANSHSTCDKCRKTFPSLAKLNKHKQGGHNIQANQTQIPGFQCTKCPKAFWTNEARERHHAEAHVFSCKICLTNCADLQALTNHQSMNKLVCKPCKRCFSTQAALGNHNSEEHAFVCKHCGEGCKTVILLELHQVSHGFECEACNQKFDSKIVLTMHQKTVHELACPNCGSPCDSPQSFLHHIGTFHLHYCPQCQGAFEDPVHLQGHIAACHDPQLECAECDAVFDTLFKLQSHVDTTHLPQKECDKCEGTKFDDQAALDKHNDSCHLFECPRCAMNLSDPRDLANHILAAHAHADKDTKSYTDSQTQAEPILPRLENDTSSSTTSEDLFYSPATAPQIY